MREERSDEIDKPRKRRGGGSGRAQAIKNNIKCCFSNFSIAFIIEPPSFSPLHLLSPSSLEEPDPRRTSRAQPNLWAPGAQPQGSNSSVRSSSDLAPAHLRDSRQSTCLIRRAQAPLFSQSSGGIVKTFYFSQTTPKTLTLVPKSAAHFFSLALCWALCWAVVQCC